MGRRSALELVGHRGNGAGPQENTVAHCLAAVAAGADRVEIDLRLHHGRIVVSHDRPTDAAPGLDEFLRAIPVPLVCHIKRSRFYFRHDRKLLDKLAGKLRPGDVVSSFWPGTLTYAKRRHPRLRTAFATAWPGYDLWFSRRLGASEYHGWYRLSFPGTVRRAHRRGLRFLSFVVNPNQRATVRRTKADGVITDAVGGWRASEERMP